MQLVGHQGLGPSSGRHLGRAAGITGRPPLTVWRRRSAGGVASDVPAMEHMGNRALAADPGPVYKVLGAGRDRATAFASPRLQGAMRAIGLMSSERSVRREYRLASAPAPPSRALLQWARTPATARAPRADNGLRSWSEACQV
jgi:hypothetical protein